MLDGVTSQLINPWTHPGSNSVTLCKYLILKALHSSFIQSKWSDLVPSRTSPWRSLCVNALSLVSTQSAVAMLLFEEELRMMKIKSD